jgi:hypothetical protein
MGLEHGLINYIESNAKCRHLKKYTCKGTTRQVFTCLREGERATQESTDLKAELKIPTWLTVSPVFKL